MLRFILDGHNNRVSAEQEFYQTEKDFEPFLFSCKFVKHVWQEVGNVSKHRLLEFYCEENVKTRFNDIMSFFGFSI